MSEQAGLRLLGERWVGSGAFLRVARLHFVAAGGRHVARDVIEHPGAVAVVPVIDDEVLLISQQRVAIGAPLLEIPAGKRDLPGEPIEETARRECEEEIGFRPGRLTLLQRVFTTPGFTNECIWVFLAEELESTGNSPQGVEEESATVIRLPITEAMRRVRRGEIEDAKTLIGLYALAARTELIS